LKLKFGARACELLHYVTENGQFSTETNRAAGLPEACDRHDSAQNVAARHIQYCQLPASVEPVVHVQDRREGRFSAAERIA